MLIFNLKNKKKQLGKKKKKKIVNFYSLVFTPIIQTMQKFCQYRIKINIGKW